MKNFAFYFRTIEAIDVRYGPIKKVAEESTHDCGYRMRRAIVPRYLQEI